MPLLYKDSPTKNFIFKSLPPPNKKKLGRPCFYIQLDTLLGGKAAAGVDVHSEGSEDEENNDESKQRKESKLC